ncbi:MAG: DUF3857 domain-containing protein [Bacteroidota bacterium]
MKLVLTIIVFSLATYIGYSQKAPIKYGRLDKEILEMTVCELDSTAPAVIICDYGYFNGNTFKFTRLLRIKILSKEGYSWANRTFSTYSKSNIRGITYNLVDGEIVEDKLKRSSIFSDHVYDNYYRMRVAMPNVKVGSVIDIEFTYSWLPSNWYFQQTIPVLRSELVIENSIYVSFRKNFFGYIPLSESSKNRWVAIDVPAFNEEPFMNSSENYITKFEIEIMKVTFPSLYINFSASWDGVCHSLKEMDDFGVPLNAGNSFIKGMAKQIKKNNFTDEEKIIAALDTLHNIKWNGDEWLYTTMKDLKFQYDKGVGNSADINIGLIVLLKKLGFEVYPVALSTRSNGLLSTYKPSLAKLNYVVAFAKVNGEFMLLDATDELLPYYLLPKRCLNQRGRIIDKDTSVWVPINPKKKYKKVAMYNLTLEDDMSLVGTINYASYDYAAYAQRKKFDVVTDEYEFVDNFNYGKEGLIINEATFSNINDIYKPLKESYDVIIENSAMQSDSLIYLSLMNYEKIEDNLFNSKTRDYPIDFTYPRERSGVITITLPPGVVISEMPEPLRLAMPDKSMDYVYSLTQMGNKLILNYRLRIIKSVINYSQYEHIKTFYEYIIEKEAEPVVLKIQ